MNVPLDTLDTLDTSWLTEFEQIQSNKTNYCCELIKYIKINCVYINHNNEIGSVHEEQILLNTPGIISRNEIIRIIKNYNYLENNKYSLLSILKFLIDIEPIHLNNFLRNKNINVGETFLQNITHIDDITFNKSLSLFHDINTLTFMFYKQKKTNKNNTKKIYIHTHHNKTRRY